MHARFIAARGQTHKGKATALCATRVHRHTGLSYVVWWNQPWRKWYQDNFFLFFSFLFEHLTKVQIISTFSDRIFYKYILQKKKKFIRIDFSNCEYLNSEIKICYLSLCNFLKIFYNFFNIRFFICLIF